MVDVTNTELSFLSEGSENASNHPQYSPSVEGSLATPEKLDKFTGFLYALREANIPVSTAEWLMFQRALASGRINGIEDFYTAARCLLVKDISYYDAFDRVFLGLSKYLIPKDDSPVQEVKEKIDSQEIVEPGYTELHHGGEDIHQEIEDSTRMMQRPSSRSLEERVSRRRHKEYDIQASLKEVNYQEALRKLCQTLSASSTTRTRHLDAQATVRQIAKRGGMPEFIFKEETEDKPRVIIFFDISHSMSEEQPVMEKLFRDARAVLGDLKVYYFWNSIYGQVWPTKDTESEDTISINDILKENEGAKVIFVGDAWMGAQEFFSDEEEKAKPLEKRTSGEANFQRIRRRFPHSIWMNPLLVDSRSDDDSGTIEAIAEIFPMYELTLSGLKDAVTTLMED